MATRVCDVTSDCRSTPFGVYRPGWVKTTMDISKRLVDLDLTQVISCNTLQGLSSSQLKHACSKVKIVELQAARFFYSGILFSCYEHFDYVFFYNECIMYDMLDRYFVYIHIFLYSQILASINLWRKILHIYILLIYATKHNNVVQIWFTCQVNWTQFMSFMIVNMIYFCVVYFQIFFLFVHNKGKRHSFVDI